MTNIEVSASKDYSALIGSGLLSQLGTLVRPVVRGDNVLLLCDERVAALYAQAAEESLRSAAFQVRRLVYPAGETNKTPEMLISILEEMARQGMTRSDVLVAMGGGVTGDMGGLAAALYQRGIDCVQVPTTLLAAVDASVGGKTAVNLPAGKNQMGVFSQPRMVVCDVDCFATLPPQVYAEGWAEVVKSAFMKDGPLAGLLEAYPDVRMEDIVAECVRIKRDIVCADEFDTGERQKLNFGHTIGHAIEKCADYGCYHGMAVAAGMCIITRACVKTGVCGAETYEKLEQLLDKFGLPKTCEFTEDALYTAARADKKRSGERITLVLPKRIGACVLKKTDFSEVKTILELGLGR
jgi:3-dehydroquinate synthase